MIKLSFEIKGDKAIISRIDGIDPRMKDRLRQAMENIGSYTMSEMKSRASSELKEKSHRLMRNFYYSVKDFGGRIVVTVGINRRVFYGALQDMGIDAGNRDVKGYARRVSGTGPDRRRKFAGFVAPYKRDIRFPARPFLKSSFMSLRDRIQADITQAVYQAVGEQ